MFVPEIAWYMDLGARGKRVWKDCPEDIKADLSFFLDHGWVVLKNAIPPDLVEKARSDFYAHKAKYRAAYERNADENGFQRRIVNLHMALDSFKDLYSKNARALAMQDYLFNRRSCCFTSLTFESGSEQTIHRDSPYFTTNPEYYYLGVWVALEHVDERNGALEVYDRGHLVQEPDRRDIYSQFYGPDDKIDDFDQRLWDGYQTEVIRQCDEVGLKRLVVPMAPGDTLIWHPHLPHGGSPIIDCHRSRLSMVNHVIPEDVSVSGLKVFFGKAEAPERAQYSYLMHDDRNFLRHANVEFQHRDPHPASEFGI